MSYIARKQEIRKGELRVKGKITALVLVVLLIFLPVGVPAEAVDTVYFTAAGENVLPLSDSTMPFWSGGYLYLPARMFTGNVWRSLDVAYVRTSRQLTILHSGGRSLMFELGKDYTKDSDGKSYEPGMIERGGEAFVPAYLVASFFGLQYSVTEVPHGFLVWLRKPGFGLTDKVFADAATSNMQSAYTAYLKEKEAETEPEQPEIVKPAPGKRLYLCMEAQEQSGALMDELHRHHATAAFFCKPEFLEEEGDLLRRMAAMGHSIGILAQGGDPEHPVEEQLSAGNRALEQATSGRTRLVFLQDASESERNSLQASGWYLLDPDLNRTDYALKNEKSANALLKKISARRGPVSVWLGDAVSAAGLHSLLSEAEDAGHRCLALNETVS